MPINVTLGYTALLEMETAGSVTEQQQEYLKRIRGSQQHLLRIITNLLAYSRIEAGQADYEITPVSLHTTIEAVMAMVEPRPLARASSWSTAPVRRGSWHGRTWERRSRSCSTCFPTPSSSLPRAAGSR
jgi:signal transduction histidine kinase